MLELKTVTNGPIAIQLQCVCYDCPAVAYLYLVKRRYHAICFPQSAYGRGLHPDLPAIAHPFIYSSRSLEH